MCGQRFVKERSELVEVKRVNLLSDSFLFTAQPLTHHQSFRFSRHPNGNEMRALLQEENIETHISEYICAKGGGHSVNI